MEVLKMNLDDMGLMYACIFTTHGQMAIDHTKRLINAALQMQGVNLPIRPINTMLLDF